MGSLALRSFAGGTLFGSQQGQGHPRVLYLHGWGRTHRDFDAVRSEQVLAGASAAVASGTGGAGTAGLGTGEAGTSGTGGYASLALDLPGFGTSPPPPNAGGANLYARLLLPTITDYDQPLILVGHSFGGRVALELAYQRPKLVSALVLTGVPLLRPLIVRKKPALKFRFMRGAHRMGLISNKTMENLRRKSGSADYRAACGVMRNVLVSVVNETYETQLKNVKMPVELVWGENDSEVVPGIAVRAETMLTDASLTILPDVGHFVPTEAPRRLAQIIARQLHTLGGAGSSSAGSSRAGNSRAGNSPAGNSPAGNQ